METDGMFRSRERQATAGFGNEHEHGLAVFVACTIQQTGVTAHDGAALQIQYFCPCPPCLSLSLSLSIGVRGSDDDMIYLVLQSGFSLK